MSLTQFLKCTFGQRLFLNISDIKKVEMFFPIKVKVESLFIYQNYGKKTFLAQNESVMRLIKTRVGLCCEYLLHPSHKNLSILSK